MSSLQCPATLLLTVTQEPEQASELARRLEGRRVAGVWSGTALPLTRTSDLLADALGVRVTPRTGLDAVGAGEHETVASARLEEVLQEVADLHRGETVLLVGDADLLLTCVPGVARMAARPAPLAPGGLVELEADEEWWCRAWDAGAQSS